MLVKVPTETSCSRCQGTGWVVQDDDGVGCARRCPCQAEEGPSRLLASARIPPRYQRCRLDNFKTTEPDAARKVQLENAVAACRRYVEDFVGDMGRHSESGLLFIGPPGVGKTHLSVGVLVELIERWGVRGRFVELTSLVHQLQSTFEPGSPETKRELIDPVVRADFLVLDELGAQNPTPWVRDLLYLLINTRYTLRLPTLFTTNYRLQRSAAKPMNLDRLPDPEEDLLATDRYGLLAHRLPPMLISRLFEMARPVLLDAVSDYRQEVQSYRHRG